MSLNTTIPKDPDKTAAAKQLLWKYEHGGVDLKDLSDAWRDRETWAEVVRHDIP